MPCVSSKKNWKVSSLPRWGRFQLGTTCFVLREKVVHPWKLTWNPKMKVWKMIFLFKQVILRFQVNFPGCKMNKLAPQAKKTCPGNSLWRFWDGENVTRTQRLLVTSHYKRMKRSRLESPGFFRKDATKKWPTRQRGSTIWAALGYC